MDLKNKNPVELKNILNSIGDCTLNLVDCRKLKFGTLYPILKIEHVSRISSENVIYPKASVTSFDGENEFISDLPARFVNRVKHYPTGEIENLFFYLIGKKTN